MRYLAILLCAISVGALAQRFPAPDLPAGDCPEGYWYKDPVIIFGKSDHLGPAYSVATCQSIDYGNGVGDDYYYIATTHETKDHEGNAGWEDSFKQYGKTWSLQITAFTLKGERQMKIDEVFENRNKALQAEFKDRDARLLTSDETPFEWYRDFSRQARFTYRDGSAKVFVKLVVGCQIILEQRVKVTCTKCDEDAIGHRELHRLDPRVLIKEAVPCR